jgi:predicted ATP-dependent Lon-type protease
VDKVTSTGILVDLRHPFLSARQSVARMVDASLTLLYSQDGSLNLGGSIETIYNPVSVVEIAIEKGAAAILMPIGSRQQLNDLPDDLAAIITTHDYLDAKAALVK